MVLAVRQMEEASLEVLGSRLLGVLQVLLVVLLKDVEDDGEEQVENEEEAEEEIGDEEETHPPVRLVSRQHHVRVVGGRHEDNHVEDGVAHVRHERRSLQGALEYGVAEPGEVEDVDDDERHHRQTALHHADVDVEVVPQ